MKVLARLMENLQGLEKRTRLRLGIGLVCLLLLVILLTAINTRVSLLIKKRQTREADVTEMLILKQRYLEASGRAQKLATRLTATRPDDSPARIIEETGIKGKGTQIKPIKGEEYPGTVEDAAEIRIEGLSANEMVNLLYGLEKGNKPLVIKKALIKSRFDDPAKLDLTLTLALLKPAPQVLR